MTLPDRPAPELAEQAAGMLRHTRTAVMANRLQPRPGMATPSDAARLLARLAVCARDLGEIARHTRRHLDHARRRGWTSPPPSPAALASLARAQVLADELQDELDGAVVAVYRLRGTLAAPGRGWSA